MNEIPHKTLSLKRVVGVLYRRDPVRSPPLERRLASSVVRLSRTMEDKCGADIVKEAKLT
jgi:hypothetical protein